MIAGRKSVGYRYGAPPTRDEDDEGEERDMARLNLFGQSKPMEQLQQDANNGDADKGAENNSVKNLLNNPLVSGFMNLVV